MEKKQARLSWAAVILVVALSITLSAIVASRIRRNTTVEVGSAYALPIRYNRPITVVEDSIYYYEGSMLSRLSDKGVQQQSYNIGVGSSFNVSKNGIAAWNGTTLQMFPFAPGVSNYSGTLGQPILSAKVGNDCAVALIGTEDSPSLQILRLSGLPADKIDFPSQTILDYGFFSDDRLIWVMALDTSGTIPTTTISTYQLNRMLIGSITDMTQVIYRTLFQSGQITLVGTSYIRTYSETGKEQTAARRTVYGYALTASDGKSQNPLLVFVPVAQSDGVTNMTDIRMLRGNVEKQLRLPFPAFKIVSLSDTVYAFSESYLMTCQIDSGSAQCYQLPIVIDSVLGVTTSKVAVVTSNGTVYLVPLP